MFPHLSLNIYGCCECPFTPNVSMIRKQSLSCIHQRNMSMIHKQHHNIPIICHICNNINTQTTKSPLQDSIRSLRRSIGAIDILTLSRVLHTQEKPINNTCRHIDNQIMYHHIHHITIIHKKNSQSYNEQDHLHASVLKE